MHRDKYGRIYTTTTNVTKRTITLEWNSHPITSRVTPSTVYQLPIIKMTADHLATPKHAPFPGTEDLDLMTQFPESLNGLLANPFLDEDSGALPGFLLGTGAGTSPDAKTWGIQRSLRVVVEGQHIQKDLYMALRLHEAAHDAVDGMEGPV